MNRIVVSCACLMTCSLVALSGCLTITGGNTNDNESTAPRVIDGYWLATERTGDHSIHPTSIVEFWKITTTASDEEQVHFVVTDGCNEDVVLGTGALAVDGRIHATNDGAFLAHVAEFTSDHEIDFHWTGDHRIVAQRIAPPACAPQPDGTGMFAPVQPMKLLLDTSEEEEPLQGKGIVTAQSTGTSDRCASVCVDTPDSGMCHLCEADGSLPSVGETKEDKTSTAAPTTKVCQNADGAETPCPTTQAEQHAGYVQCDQKVTTEVNHKTVTDSMMLSDSEELYPGALVQGGSFGAGTFVPITIPRSGSAFIFSGITFQPGVSSTVNVSEVRPDTVADAITAQLQNAGLSVANITFETKQYQSDLHFAADVGADISYMSDAMKAGFSAKTVGGKRTNVIVTTFHQVFYKVSMATPQHPWSVFADGENFEDPDFQIGDGNPPLYVANVTYGRQVLVFIHSSHSELEVKVAMEAAYKDASSGTDVSGNASAETKAILDEVEINYFVRGGASAPALSPLAAGTDGFYQSLVNFLSDEVLGAGYSANNPGAPISYTLKYVGWPRPKGMSNQPAFKAYAATYDELTCHTIPPGASSIAIQFSNFKHDAFIWVDPTTFSAAASFHYNTSAGKVTVPLNNNMTDSDNHTVQIRLISQNCFSPAKGRVEILKDGAAVWKKNINVGFSWSDPFGDVGGCVVGNYADASFVVNRKNGTVQLTHYSELPAQ